MEQILQDYYKKQEIYIVTKQEHCGCAIENLKLQFQAYYMTTYPEKYNLIKNEI
jgi:hypothetical protein